MFVILKENEFVFILVKFKVSFEIVKLLISFSKKSFKSMCRRITLHPIGYPFRIFNEMFAVLDLIRVPFLLVINCKAAKEISKFFNSYLLKQNCTIIDFRIGFLGCGK